MACPEHLVHLGTSLRQSICMSTNQSTNQPMEYQETKRHLAVFCIVASFGIYNVETAKSVTGDGILSDKNIVAQKIMFCASQNEATCNEHKKSILPQQNTTFFVATFLIISRNNIL